VNSFVLLTTLKGKEEKIFKGNAEEKLALDFRKRTDKMKRKPETGKGGKKLETKASEEMVQSVIGEWTSGLCVKRQPDYRRQLSKWTKK